MAGRIFDEVPNAAGAIQVWYEKKMNTDFKFYSKDKHIIGEAHKLVLIMRSPVFSQFFALHDNVDCIEMDDVNDTAVKNMIQYLYDKNIGIESIDDLKDTTKLAKRYLLHGLERMCKEKLIDINISISNVIHVLQTALEFEDEAKETACLNFINEKKEMVFTSKPFISLKFEEAIEIFEKLRDRNLTSDATFLRFAIQWMVTNNILNKKMDLLQKIDMANVSERELAHIMYSFPDFFNSKEMACVWKGKTSGERCMKLAERLGIFCETETDGSSSVKTLCSVGTNTENEFCKKQTSTAVQTCSETSTASQLRNVATSTDIAAEEDEYLGKIGYQGKIKHLKVQILECGPNPCNWEKRAKITAQDDFGERSFQIELNDHNKGIFKCMLDASAEHNSYNTGISYPGILYFSQLYLGESDVTPTPLEYLEVLNAAFVFESARLFDKIKEDICKIEDCDPVFLDGLRRITDLEGRCQFQLKSKTEKVLIHPNFIHSSSKLVNMILQQNELSLKNEGLLLSCTISWLRAEICCRKQFEFDFLKLIAFENISSEDFKYVVRSNRGFFSSEDIQAILDYKNSEGDKRMFFRKKLPKWYSFKTRKFFNVS